MEERRQQSDDLFDRGQQSTLPGAFRLGYPLPRGSWDEMFGPDGLPRPHCEGFFNFVANLPREDVHRRWDLGMKLIRDNGVTYNVYGGDDGLDRPWQLDPLPLMITAEEWRAIEAALIQRATLLNLVLADLYGAQDLLAQGLIPPVPVLSHPGYLRPLKDVRVPRGVFLHLYAADIARAPDGSWQVVSDRCEAPSGAGYALENRTIIGRLLADAMRDQKVRSLAPFFQKFRESLLEMSPRARETPRIVLLTPGPYNETFFEHAYLARQMGYTLVEGEDLTMRDGRVWLKTLDGLQPIDVILRRTTGPFCDPLELRNDSILGVAGLTRAVRAGTVVVANALGSGVVEGGALSPFLPGLARHLLGEDLKMPSVRSWWCGFPADLQHVLGNIESLVLKPSYPRPGKAGTVFGDRLSESRRQDLVQQIMERPRDFMAQERIRLSTTPVWNGESLEARPMMLRVYLTALDDGYIAMPGGLGRVAGEAGGSMVSLQAGGGSKDVWVLADKAEKAPVAARSQNQAVRLVRGARDMPSRVADNLYWFGRYVERIDNTTRMLRAALVRAGSTAAFGAAEELPVALGLLGRLFKTHGATDEAKVAATIATAFGPAHSDGLRFTSERIHRMASLTRDRLSPDTWRAVNHLLQTVSSAGGADGLLVEEALNGLNNLVLASEALSGLMMENMTRGLAWRFVDVGRRLERAVHMLDILSGTLPHGESPSGPALDVLLEISDSSMTYRSRYLSAPQFAPVWDLLMVDESNPRSLGFQLASLAAHMDMLAAHRRTTFLGPEQRLTVWLTGAVRTAEVEKLCIPDEDGEVRTLARFMEGLLSKLWELSEEVTKQYFTHSAGRSSVVRAAPEAWP
jgi:uncharacterized circularly permuted ATP-grasp superfamily protein/uncharacterized alpha-E superfamily protein